MSAIKHLMPDIIRYFPIMDIKAAPLNSPVLQNERTISKVTAELLAKLNEMAKAYPFNIHYRMKNNDPL